MLSQLVVKAAVEELIVVGVPEPEHGGHLVGVGSLHRAALLGEKVQRS